MDVVIYAPHALDLTMVYVMAVFLQHTFIICIAFRSIIVIREHPFNYSILPSITLPFLLDLLFSAVDAFCKLFQAPTLGRSDSLLITSKVIK